MLLYEVDEPHLARPIVICLESFRFGQEKGIIWRASSYRRRILVMPQCYNTSLADHAHTEGNKSELFPWIRNNNHLSCKQQQAGTWRNNYTVLPHGNLAEVRCSWRHIHKIPGTKMAARRPFLGRLSNPVSPHVFSLIHVRCGLVVELEHTGPHASENHLSVPLEHHFSTPI